MRVSDGLIIGGAALVAYFLFRSKEYTTDQMKWLDEKLISWKPTEENPKINYGAYHVFASDNMFVKSDETVDQELQDMIFETGCNITVLYIRKSSWDSQRQRYTNLIEKIRASGQKLVVGARFDDILMTFAQYEQESYNFVWWVIRNIKPDYYISVVEPMTMESKYKFNATDEQWHTLILNCSDFSKSFSPTTKTMVGGAKGDLELLNKLVDIMSLDIIGYNIYNAGGIDENSSSWLGDGDVVGTSIDYVNANKKETWILETWTKWNPGTNPSLIPYDSKWLRVMTYYGMKHNMKCMIPFFTGKFVTYTDNETELRNAIMLKMRTPVFTEFQNLVKEFQSWN